MMILIFIKFNKETTNKMFEYLYFSQLIGLFVVDVNVSGLDINQCEAAESSSDNNSKHQDDGTISTITSFQSTHKCHNTSRVSVVGEKMLEISLTNDACLNQVNFLNRRE